MEILLTILAPVFGVILCGFLARRSGFLLPAGVDLLNRYVYYFALPPLLFTLTARAPARVFLNGAFIAAYLGGTLATLALAAAGGRWLFRLRRIDLILHALTAAFGNTAYMGIPLFLTAFGPEGALPAVVATVAANVCILSALMIAIEAGLSSSFGAGSPFRSLVRSTVTNPLLAASVLGVVCSAAALAVPGPVQSLLDLLAQPAAPAALFTLGMSLAGKRLRAQKGEVAWLVAVKLAAHPLLTWLIARRLPEMEPLWFQAAILLAAMPVGSLVFVVSQLYDVRSERASAAVVVSTLLSVGTLWVVWERLG
jgi:malonate transporter